VSFLGKPVRGLLPEVVSAIMRAPDDAPEAMYPARIGVNCDECWAVVSDDYIVNDAMTKSERHEAARTHLRTQGWSCTPELDLCPTCVTTYNQEGL
jgi:hypothetical protein